MAGSLEAKDGVLHYVKDGKSFALKGGAFTEVVVAGAEDTAESISGDSAKRILNELLVKIKAGDSALTKEVKALLPAAIGEFGSEVHSGLLTEVKEGLSVVTQLETATTKAEAEALLNGNKIAKSLLTEKASTKLAELKFDMQAFEAGLKKAADKLADVKKANDGLAALMKAEKPSIKEIDAFIMSNLQHLDELAPGSEAISNAQLKGKFNFSGAVTQHKANIQVEATKLEQLAKDLIKNKDVVALQLGDDAEKAAKDAITKIEGEISKSSATPYGKAARGKLPEKLVKELGEVHPDMASKLGATAAEGANKPSWIKRLFTVTQEHIDDKIKAAGSDTKALEKAKELKLGNTRWGRVATGVGAGLVAVYAGVSMFGRDKEPKSYVEAENQRRTAQGQTTGVTV